MSSSAGSSSDSESDGQGHDAVVAGGASTAVSTVAGPLVRFDLRKARTCLLCNSGSSDQSPLEYTDEIYPETGGRLPWRSYEKRKLEDGTLVRVPSGRLDLVCFNVYRGLGTLA